MLKHVGFYVERCATPLIVACKGYQSNAAQLLLSMGADVNEVIRGRVALHWAAESGYLGVVKVLLDNGASVNLRVVGGGGTANDRGNTALHLAASNCHFDVAKFLVENGADVHLRNIISDCPLDCAASGGDTALVKLLLDSGATVDAQSDAGETPLHRAAQSGHLNVVRLLLQKGANVNLCYYGNRAALHCAADVGDAGVAKLLLAHGADVNLRGQEHMTPLHSASCYKYETVCDCLDVVKLLLENGADVNAVQENGYTALHYAAWSVRPDIVKIIVDHGGNVNAQTMEGETPLHLVLSTDDLLDIFVMKQRRMPLGAVLKLLLYNGADDSLVNSEGETAAEIARDTMISDEAVFVLSRGFAFRCVYFIHGKAEARKAKKRSKAPFTRVAGWEDMLWLCAVWLLPAGEHHEGSSQ